VSCGDDPDAPEAPGGDDHQDLTQSILADRDESIFAGVMARHRDGAGILEDRINVTKIDSMFPEVCQCLHFIPLEPHR
jgi:hypothetical protein